MYLSTLKLWNFRKYSEGPNEAPGIEISFNKGVNVLIGENDSGKTAIVDAIRYVLKTKSGEPIYWEEKDFYMDKAGNRSRKLKIECVFEGISETEAAPFLEWIGLKDVDGKSCYCLRLTLNASILDDGRIYPEVKAGMGREGTVMDGRAKDLLRVVYLKPLRDALQDMTHGKRSRIAQILRAHNIFSEKSRSEGGIHKLEELYKRLSDDINKYFDKAGEGEGREITQRINDILSEHFLMAGDKREAYLSLTGSDLIDILRQIDLVLESNKSGLGSLNLLCIAAELLLFYEANPGLKLTLIEELEAHLHPQYQLRLLDYIREQEKLGQFILTTHSISVASNIPLEHLVVLKGDKAFPMGSQYTCCKPDDYQFLHRFLDATKANLFFAKGVIMVEGDAENLLLPTIAEIIGRPLHKHGVSIVNVGNTAYKRYAKIFERRDGQQMGVPVAVVADLDVRSIEYYKDEEEKRERKVLQCTEGVKNDLNGRCSSVDFSHLPEYVFSVTELNDYLTNHKKEGERKVKSQDRENVKEYFKTKSQQITESCIDYMRTQRRTILGTQFENPEIQVFAAQYWTLEYEIAKSGLFHELAAAVYMAKEEKAGRERSIEKSLQKSLEEYKGETNDVVAYEIFKPINDGDVSKAIVAQYLAEILMSRKDDYKAIMEDDPCLKYIVDSIKHVTCTEE